MAIRRRGGGNGAGPAKAVDLTRVEQVDFANVANVNTAAWVNLTPTLDTAKSWKDGVETGTELEILEQIVAADVTGLKFRLKGGTYLFIWEATVTGDHDRASPRFRVAASGSPSAEQVIAESDWAYLRTAGAAEIIRLNAIGQVSAAEGAAGIYLSVGSVASSVSGTAGASNRAQWDALASRLLVVRWGGGDGAGGPTLATVNSRIQAAVTALIGGATSAGNTLKKLEDRIGSGGGGGGLTRDQVNALIEAITDPLSNRVSTNRINVSTAFSRITDLEGGVPAHVLAQTITHQFDSSDTNPPGDYEFYRHSDSSISLVITSSASDRTEFRAATEMYINNAYTRVTPVSITNGVRYTLDGVSVDSDVDVLTIHLPRYQSAAETPVDASGFDGQLATTDNTVQKVAQKLDDLTISGGGITQQQATALILAWARTGNTATIPLDKFPASLATDSDVTAAIETVRGAGIATDRNTLKKLSDLIDNLGAVEPGLIGTFRIQSGQGPDAGRYRRGSATRLRLGVASANLRARMLVTRHIWIGATRYSVTWTDEGTGVLQAVLGGAGISAMSSIKVYWDPTPGSTPTPQREAIYFGVVGGAVDTEAEIRPLISGLTNQNADISGHEITLGPTTVSGQRFVILVPADHDLAGLINTALGDDEKSQYTRIAWAGAEVGGESIVSYHSVALRLGASITYRVTLNA